MQEIMEPKYLKYIRRTLAPPPPSHYHPSPTNPQDEALRQYGQRRCRQRGYFTIEFHSRRSRHLTSFFTHCLGVIPRYSTRCFFLLPLPHFHVEEFRMFVIRHYQEFHWFVMCHFSCFCTEKFHLFVMRHYSRFCVEEFCMFVILHYQEFHWFVMCHYSRFCSEKFHLFVMCHFSRFCLEDFELFVICHSFVGRNFIRLSCITIHALFRGIRSVCHASLSTLSR